MFATFVIQPNQRGYLFRSSILEQELEPGLHRFFDARGTLRCIVLPTTTKLLVVSNQEVLTKDQVALRFSFNILYAITDAKKMLQQFELSAQKDGNNVILSDLAPLIHNYVQVHLRNKIAETESMELNAQRATLFESSKEELQPILDAFGITLHGVVLRDITFPKMIQDLFATLLESKIKAKADLENARTTVAVARTLKNAAELLQQDPDARFVRLLDTMTTISRRGKHQFVFGDLQNMLHGESLAPRTGRDTL